MLKKKIVIGESASDTTTKKSRGEPQRKSLRIQDQVNSAGILDVKPKKEKAPKKAAPKKEKEEKPKPAEEKKVKEDERKEKGAKGRKGAKSKVADDKQDADKTQ